MRVNGADNLMIDCGSLAWIDRARIENFFNCVETGIF